MSYSALRVWLVDDDASIRWVLERALKNASMTPRLFESAESALVSLRTETPDVLMTDIRMSGQSGLELLKRVHDQHPDLPVIVMTAHSDLGSAVSAYESGAFEYLPKPFDIDQAVELVRRAAQAAVKSGEAAAPPAQMSELLGRAPAMQQVFRAIGRLSRSSVNVLVTGESGTGKELAARALHEHSPRANRAFIALNTSAIPGELLESELFGHEKGAFTGADALRRGRFEQADGGTLFLDEIGDMNLPLQTRLLRVLAEGEFYRVGGQTPIHVDVRVIAATHQNLEERVARGQFREDLFHRLNVIRIELPPLRQRREDIPDLLGHYLSLAAIELGVEAKTLTKDALERLTQYGWPGQRARAGEPVPSPDGARAGQRSACRGPADGDLRRQCDDGFGRGLDRQPGQLGRAGHGWRRFAAARRGAAAVRADADQRRAEAHAGASPGRREAARLGPQHADPQAQGAGDGRLPGIAMPRIALIHALEESVAPAHAAFRAHWPEAELFDVMDAGLAPDLAAAGAITPDIARRIEGLAHQALATTGPAGTTAGILYTCSAFGPAIDAVKQLVPVPVLRPNECAFEAALDHGGPIGLVVSFGPSAAALAAELRDMAAARGQAVEVTTALATGALEALKSGDGRGTTSWSLRRRRASMPPCWCWGSSRWRGPSTR